MRHKNRQKLIKIFISICSALVLLILWCVYADNKSAEVKETITIPAADFSPVKSTEIPVVQETSLNTNEFSIDNDEQLKDIEISSATSKTSAAPETPVASKTSAAPETPVASKTPYASEKPIASPLPEGFVYVRDINSGIRVDLRYADNYNFTGTIVDGYYTKDKAIMTEQAARSLSDVQDYLETQGLGLIIYDSYRPKRAVQFFSQWSKNSDNSMKEEFYPNIEKSQLHSKGYIALKSAHSRGSTVDLSLVDLESGNELDMGGHFDMLDPISHYGIGGIGEDAVKNRNILKSAMEMYGFSAYSKEWWHFTYKNEPFKDVYFDFDVR